MALWLIPIIWTKKIIVCESSVVIPRCSLGYQECIIEHFIRVFLHISQIDGPKLLTNCSWVNIICFNLMRGRFNYNNITKTRQYCENYGMTIDLTIVGTKPKSTFKYLDLYIYTKAANNKFLQLLLLF